MNFDIETILGNKLARNAQVGNIWICSFQLRTLDSILEIGHETDIQDG